MAEVPVVPLAEAAGQDVQLVVGVEAEQVDPRTVETEEAAAVPYRLWAWVGSRGHLPHSLPHYLQAPSGWVMEEAASGLEEEHEKPLPAHTGLFEDEGPLRIGMGRNPH